MEIPDPFFLSKTYPSMEIRIDGWIKAAEYEIQVAQTLDLKREWTKTLNGLYRLKANCWCGFQV